MGLGLVGAEHFGHLVPKYDDDDGSEGIVYLGEPFVSEYIRLPREALEKVQASSLELERWKRAYPWLAKYVGVP
jgi:hypothetical protein